MRNNESLGAVEAASESAFGSGRERSGASRRHRLSVEECRRIVGPDCHDDDQRMQRLRDYLYTIADFAIDEYLSLRRQPTPVPA